ncbi:MAG TPA: carboxypeptidase-like regulatory domain-containing protein [Candidatus Sulfotelmatobacter sp.]|nr:carboxypeptidase-like regulatory domain-containing protein [Candidatus Sulfotelmatobacter sp.]
MNLRSLFRISLLLALALAAAVPAHTQTKEEKKEAQLRTVRGVVLDKDENPAPSSVVYLKNTKTQGVKTYIADDTGHFRFSGLDPNIDYELHAERNDMTSPTRQISSFETKRDIDISLKLSHKKNAH